MRQEEALADRPRARPPVRGAFGIDLLDPRPGVPYFKLAFDAPGLAFLMRVAAEVPPETLDDDSRSEVRRPPAGSTLQLPLEGEHQAFLSHWLRQFYQREAASTFGRAEPRAQQIHVGFPTFLTRRTEELAALFRFPGTLSWLATDGELWTAPDYAARRAKVVPEPPECLRLEAEGKAGEEAGPFFLDTQILSRVLGVNEEELADFFGCLREAEGLTGLDVVTAVCHLLEHKDGWSGPIERAGPTANPVTLAERLLAAIRRNLPPGDISVFPIGLVTDDSRIQATWHLQRDLLVLLKHPPGEGLWGRGTPLWHYLAGDPASAGHQLPRGLRLPRALTEGQLEAAARFLGSTLAAAQGPPGTGKTDLIAQLVADTLVTRVRRLSEGRAMGQTLLLVTSTNNRAVDNVLEALSRPDGLPLGLRTGNLEVTASLTAETLARARQWLKVRDLTDAKARYTAALAEFESALAEVDAALAPYEAGRAEHQRRERLVDRLADLDEELRTLPGSLAGAEEAQHRLKQVRRVLGDLENLLALQGVKAVRKAGILWRAKVLDKGLLTELGTLLAPLGHTFAAPMPSGEFPEDTEEVLEDQWVEAVDDALEAADVLRDALQVVVTAHQARRRRDAVAQELAELETSVSEAPSAPPTLAGPHAILFALAERVRETWATHHASEVDAALRKALERTSARGSLRSLFEKDPETATWLRRLFPVMGCTLLSLGNLFPPEPGLVERVVIDEAGQCHPAYALAALLRAERALVIGDVNQLQPVVRLTALDEQRIRRAADIDLTDEQLAPYRVFAENPASAQGLADRAVKVRPVLRDHFRCQPAIIALSDRLCGYRLTVHTPGRSLRDRVPWLTDPVLLLPVQGQQVQARGSWANPAEAEQVIEVLRQLSLRGVLWEDIALLTPYVGQLDLIRQRLRQVGVPLEADREAYSTLTQPSLIDTGTLATGTVHRFQGGERTVVVFSTVVARERSLGFLNARVNLVNVAVSRARDHLIIVGDPETLARGAFTRVLTDRAVPLQPEG